MYLKASEAAILLKCSVQTVYNYVKLGKLEAVRVVKGGDLRIPSDQPLIERAVGKVPLDEIMSRVISSATAARREATKARRKYRR